MSMLEKPSEINQLFTPITMRKLTVRNRIFMSSMDNASMTRFPDPEQYGHDSPKTAEYYRARAKGGVGMINSGYHFICRRGQGLYKQSGVHSDDTIPAIKRCVDAVHAEGAAFCLQINHAGRETKPLYCQTTPEAPSADAPSVIYVGTNLEQLTRWRIKEIEKAHADAALRAKEVAKALLPYIDYIIVSTGNYWGGPAGSTPGFLFGIAPMSIPLNPILHLTAGIKEEVNVPVGALSSYNDPYQCEAVLQNGYADFIVMGRQLIADPDWPNKAREGKFDEIRTCIRDNLGCINRVFFGLTVGCTQNAAVMQEKEAEIKPAEKKKKVLIIGGGIAGMEAARVAARLRTGLISKILADISEAEVIVAGGKGVGSRENFQMLRDLADIIGAAVAGSRISIDNGWVERERQIGQSGKAVAPLLMISCGISGASAHVIGMKNAKKVIAINKDQGAAIFKLATLGVGGDQRDVVKLEFSIDNDRECILNRRVARGDRVIVKGILPALFTIDMGINIPRYPTVISRLRAASKMERLSVKMLDSGNGFQTLKVINFSEPKLRASRLGPDPSLSPQERVKWMMTGGVSEKKGDKVSGNPENCASKIIDFLIQNRVISQRK